MNNAIERGNFITFNGKMPSKVLEINLEKELLKVRTYNNNVILLDIDDLKYHKVEIITAKQYKEMDNEIRLYSAVNLAIGEMLYMHVEGVYYYVALTDTEGLVDAEYVLKDIKPIKVFKNSGEYEFRKDWLEHIFNSF